MPQTAMRSLEDYCLDVQDAIEKARDARDAADGFADTLLISHAFGLVMRGKFQRAHAIADELARKYARFM